MTQEGGEIDVTKVTEVTVTSVMAGDSHHKISNSASSHDVTDASAAYSVDVFAAPHPTTAPLPPEGVRDVASMTGGAATADYHIDSRVRRRTEMAAFTYTKCAMLFFAAMLITWIPSSANRLFALVAHRGSPPLEVMSAFVLPLQGLWNAIIYISTSRAACLELFMDLRIGRRPHVTEIVGSGGHEQSSGYQMGMVRKALGRSRDGEDNDSTASFAREGAESTTSRQ